jgi:hypothetical protein
MNHKCNKNSEMDNRMENDVDKDKELEDNEQAQNEEIMRLIEFMCKTGGRSNQLPISQMNPAIMASNMMM